MNWKELKTIAVQNGIVFVRHGKKHDIYRNEETGQTIQVERHWSQEVRNGLLKHLKQVIGF